jgi:hypothetical protein
VNSAALSFLWGGRRVEVKDVIGFEKELSMLPCLGCEINN